MVPAAVTMTASSLLAPRLARHIRPAYVISAGLAVAITGLLLISQADELSPVVVGWALVTLGSGPMVVLSVDMVTGRESYAGAVAAAHGLPSRIAAAFLSQSRAAFTGGMHVTATISATLLAGVALAAIILLRQIRPNDEAVPATGPDHTAGADASPAVR